MLSHFTSTNISTAAKKTRKGTSYDTLLLKVVVEVSQLTDPLTSFLVIRAAYFETVDFTLKRFVTSCIVEHVGFTARGTFIFRQFLRLEKTNMTKMMSTVSEEWLCEWLEANRALVVDICFVY